MELIVVNTGSSGNCYILENEHEALIIECGISFRKIKQALNFSFSKVVGCIVTHSHGDHARSIKDTVAAGIDVWASKATHEACGTTKNHRCKILKENHKITLGSFQIKAFEVVHDVPTFGFYLYHKECGRTLFLTDTKYSPLTFPDLNNIIIEANYSREIMRVKLSENEFLKDRVVNSHMSLDTCIEFLKANNLRQVNNIVLIHLSDSNSDEKLFRTEVTKATGKTVTVADNGLVMELNKTPF